MPGDAKFKALVERLGQVSALPTARRLPEAALGAAFHLDADIVTPNGRQVNPFQLYHNWWNLLVGVLPRALTAP